MKLDVSQLRYLTTEDFRILSAIEASCRSYEVIPFDVISRYTGIRPGGLRKHINDLARLRLITIEKLSSCHGSNDNSRSDPADGVRLGYGAYDYLALNTLTLRGSLVSIGMQIGVGKESDIYLVNDGEAVIKLERLGRTSFRQVKNLRDYHGRRKHISWLYLSRLAAHREFQFMKALYERNFPVPKPIDHNRHVILMQYINGILLDQVDSLDAPKDVYLQTLTILKDLLHVGLVHGDFNQFNLMIVEEEKTGREKVIMIDFPQMVDVKHEKAEEYFERDVQGIINFFGRRFNIQLNEQEMEEWIPQFDVPEEIILSPFITGCEDDELEVEEEDNNEEDPTPTTT